MINKSLLARLARYKKAASGSKYSTDWRDHRASSDMLEQIKRTITKRSSHWFCDDDTLPIIWSQKDEGFGRERITGYYINDYCNQICYGIIAQINLGKRGSAYLVGYAEQDCGGFTVLPLSLTIHKGDDMDLHDLKYSAAYYAEKEAEKMRDCYKKDELEQTIERERETVKDCKKQSLELARSLRDLTLPDAVCKALQRDLNRTKKQIAQAYKTIKKARSELPYYAQMTERYENEA